MVFADFLPRLLKLNLNFWLKPYEGFAFNWFQAESYVKLESFLFRLEKSPQRPAQPTVAKKNKKAT